jgi:hypothetical protein
MFGKALLVGVVAVLGQALLLGSVILLSGCGYTSQNDAKRKDPLISPVIEGCKLERYEVTVEGYRESVYIARCQDQKVTTVSATVSCGKSCLQKTTTITEIIGTEDKK